LQTSCVQTSPALAHGVPSAFHRQSAAQHEPSNPVALPSSHASQNGSTAPLPQTGGTQVPAPSQFPNAQTRPLGSKLQIEVQHEGNAPAALPSSHCSPASRILSPQPARAHDAASSKRPTPMASPVLHGQRPGFVLRHVHAASIAVAA
jgi:hypothetical protein